MTTPQVFCIIQIKQEPQSMSERSVTTAEFFRHFGRYHAEARRAPLTLTNHGRPSLVVSSADTYERLTAQSDPRRAYAVGETPPDLAALIVSELDRQSAEHPQD
ncbi:type II toxin-antitoxin system prevent-host-death family antitoxin [Acinetobacter baumannii]